MDIQKDQALTNMSQLWKNPDGDLIAPLVFPRINVKAASGTFPSWGKESLIIRQDLTRTGKALTREISINPTKGTWGPLTEKALKAFIAKDQYKLVDSAFDIESQTLEVIKSQMALSEEYAASKILTDTSIITNNVSLTSGSKFTDAGVDPIDTLVNALKLFRKKAFKLPNTMIIGYDAFIALTSHPAVVERFKYVQAGIIGEGELLRVLAPFGIQSIRVGKAQGTLEDTENPDHDPEIIDLWGDNVIFTYITSTPGLMQVNGGYTLALEGAQYVDKWTENDPKGTYVRNNDYNDQVIFSTDVYYLIADVL